jgi:hypothetical protein
MREEELAYQRVQRCQGRLYEGLYDSRKDVSGEVRLLNPSYGDDDPQARRFSLIEVD